MFAIIEMLMMFAITYCAIAVFLYPIARIAIRAANLEIPPGKETYFATLVFPIYLLTKFAVLVILPFAVGACWLTGWLINIFVENAYISYSIPALFLLMVFLISIAPSEQDTAKKQLIADIDKASADMQKAMQVSSQNSAQSNESAVYHVGFSADAKSNEFWDENMRMDTAPLSEKPSDEQIKALMSYMKTKKQFEVNYGRRV